MVVRNYADIEYDVGGRKYMTIRGKFIKLKLEISKYQMEHLCLFACIYGGRAFVKEDVQSWIEALGRDNTSLNVLFIMQVGNKMWEELHK